jgi:hypothetical protein
LFSIIEAFIVMDEPRLRDRNVYGDVIAYFRTSGPCPVRTLPAAVHLCGMLYAASEIARENPIEDLTNR